MKKLTVELTMPVYNEQEELKKSVLTLYDFCTKYLDRYDWHITIADNASTDQTSRIGQMIAKKNKQISIVVLKQKGRGRAVKQVWLESNADICCYMDIDLSTDLSHLPELVHALEGTHDIAIGSRLQENSKVIDRTAKREFISRSYNMLVKLLFRIHFSDAQCGFKAVTKEVVTDLIPHIMDNEWFTDTELLIVGEKLGYKVYEIPVLWRDNPGSTVRVLPTAVGDLEGLYRLFVTRPWNNLPHLRKS